MQTTKHDGFRLSNLALLAVIGVLGVGILLDGTLYNKPPVTTAIHQLADAHTVELQLSDLRVLSFKKIDNQWQQTQPVKAPALSPRVQILLDTNKYNQRSYALDDVPVLEIFTNPVVLKINDTEFQIGTVEPVSKLRYVRSGDRVYLQPDSVIPMLGAADTVFTDLKITGEVEQVTIGDTALPQATAWSNLTGLALVNHNPLDPASDNQPIQIKLIDENQPRQLMASYSDAGYLISSETGFTYLLDTAKAESLGLTDLLP